MNRRELFKRLVAVGLIAAVPEPLKRYWQLDQTMVGNPTDVVESNAEWFLETERFFASPIVPRRTWTIVMTVDPQASSPWPIGIDPDGWQMGDSLLTRRRDLETVDDPRWFYSREKVIA